MRSALMLLANDMESTVAFYRDVLGFTVAATYGDPPTWCSLRYGDTDLMFVWYPPHDHAPGEEHDHPVATLTGVMYFYPDDVRAFHDALTGKWEIAEEIGLRPHGMVEFDVFDPNGYRLRFGGRS